MQQQHTQRKEHSQQHTKTIDVIVVEPTGIEDVTVEDMMQAFPNPFENEVYLSFVEDGVYTVEIYDNAGRMLGQSSLSATAGEVYPITVDGESGIYFIKVKGDAGLLKVMKVAKKQLLAKNNNIQL